MNEILGLNSASLWKQMIFVKPNLHGHGLTWREAAVRLTHPAPHLLSWAACRRRGRERRRPPLVEWWASHPAGLPIPTKQHLIFSSYPITCKRQVMFNRVPKSTKQHLIFIQQGFKWHVNSKWYSTGLPYQLSIRWYSAVIPITTKQQVTLSRTSHKN